MICLNYELYFRETIVYVRMYVVLTLSLLVVIFSVQVELEVDLK